MNVKGAASVTKKWRVGVLAVCVLAFLAVAAGQNRNTRQSTPTTGRSTPAGNGTKLVERGRYIVEGLSRCGQCHTPRSSQGELEQNHWLEGAAVWLEPAEHVEDWPLQAPRIAGDPPGSDEDLVKLLTTGIWRDGRPLRQPMPQFRMNTEDAQAVVAYLRSLTPGQR